MILENNQDLCRYRQYLINSEMSSSTVAIYCREVQNMIDFAGERKINKGLLIEYKNSLIDREYAPRTINVKISALNSFLCFIGQTDMQLKHLRVQTPTYCSSGKVLTKEEYINLLNNIDDRELNLLIQTLASTGIRVSELKFFTVEVLSDESINIINKGKVRTILIPYILRVQLKEYAAEKQIETGPIFRNSKGNPIGRTYIWKKLQKLGDIYYMEKGKLYPHNFRKLFARTFYEAEHDISKLADILGHSSINTTRLYIMTTCEENQKCIDGLGLAVNNTINTMSVD